jgi:hypothetical protein
MPKLKRGFPTPQRRNTPYDLAQNVAALGRGIVDVSAALGRGLVRDYVNSETNSDAASTGSEYDSLAAYHEVHPPRPYPWPLIQPEKRRKIAENEKHNNQSGSTGGGISKSQTFTAQELKEMEQRLEDSPNNVLNPNYASPTMRKFKEVMDERKSIVDELRQVIGTTPTEPFQRTPLRTPPIRTPLSGSTRSPFYPPPIGSTNYPAINRVLTPQPEAKEIERGATPRSDPTPVTSIPRALESYTPPAYYPTNTPRAVQPEVQPELQPDPTQLNPIATSAYIPQTPSAPPNEEQTPSIPPNEEQIPVNPTQRTPTPTAPYTGIGRRLGDGGPPGPPDPGPPGGGGGGGGGDENPPPRGRYAGYADDINRYGRLAALAGAGYNWLSGGNSNNRGNHTGSPPSAAGGGDEIKRALFDDGDEYTDDTYFDEEGTPDEGNLREEDNNPNPERRELDLHQVNKPYVQLPTAVDTYAAHHGFTQEIARPNLYGNIGIGAMTEQFFNTYANYKFPYSFSEQSGAKAAKRLRRTMIGRPMLAPTAYMTGGLAELFMYGLQPPVDEPGNSRNQVALMHEDARNFMRYASIQI